MHIMHIVNMQNVQDLQVVPCNIACILFGTLMHITFCPLLSQLNQFVSTQPTGTTTTSKAQPCFSFPRRQLISCQPVSTPKSMKGGATDSAVGAAVTAPLLLVLYLVILVHRIFSSPESAPPLILQYSQEYSPPRILGIRFS